MEPNTVRAGSRVALGLVGALAVFGAWGHAADLALAGEDTWIEFWRAAAFTVVVAAILGLTELARRAAERRPVGVAGPIAVVAAGMVLVVVAMGLAANAWPGEPSPLARPAAEGRAVLEGVLDAMIVAAGSDGRQIGDAVAGLPRQGSAECRHEGEVYGESLSWHYEARSTAPASSWTMGANEVVDVSSGAKAAADRVAGAMEAQGFKAHAGSVDARITISGMHPDGSFVLVQIDVYETNALRDIDRTRWRRLLDAGTVLLHVQVDATTQCLQRA